MVQCWLEKNLGWGGGGLNLISVLGACKGYVCMYIIICMCTYVCGGGERWVRLKILLLDAYSNLLLGLLGNCDETYSSVIYEMIQEKFRASLEPLWAATLYGYV